MVIRNLPQEIEHQDQAGIATVGEQFANSIHLEHLGTESSYKHTLEMKLMSQHRRRRSVAEKSPMLGRPFNGLQSLDMVQELGKSLL